MKKKRCRFCRGGYYPDGRCKNPLACPKIECQRRRRNISHKTWRQSDPEILKDRRQYNRQWFIQHPDYLETYRRGHLEYVLKNRMLQKKRDWKKTSRNILISQSSNPSNLLNNHVNLQS